MSSGGDIERQRLAESDSLQLTESGPKPNRETIQHIESKMAEGRNDTEKKQRNCTAGCILRFWMVFLYYSPLKVKHNIGFSCSWIQWVWLFFVALKLGFLIKYTTDIAEERSHLGTLVTNGHISLQHLLLRGWNSGEETLPYPPAHGAFAVYNVVDLEKSINYAVAQYYNADELATGYFIRIDNDGIDVRIKYFNMSLDNKTHTRSNLSVKTIRFVPKYGLSRSRQDGRLVYGYNITKDLVANNVSFVFQSVLSVELNMSIHSVRVDESSEEARCLCVYITVSFKDRNHDGQVSVLLETTTPLIECKTMRYDIKEQSSSKADSGPAIAFLVISSCINGVGLLAWIFLAIKNCCKCLPKLDKRWQSCRNILPGVLETAVFFSGDCVPLHAIFKISRKKQDGKTLKDLDCVMLILAFGVFFSVCTLLRFLKVNTKFSILIKTMKKALYPVACFFFWIAVLFVAFLLFAYVVFGPYHTKFNTMSKSLLTLFSIINGDEIYATVSITQDDYAGRPKEIRDMINVFVYVYVSVFTILVLNLFVAIFLTAYEEVKRETEDGVQLSNLAGFLKQHWVKQPAQTLNQLSSGISKTYENQRVVGLLKTILAVLENTNFESATVEELLGNLESLLSGQNQLTQTGDFPKLKELHMLAVVEEDSVEGLLTDLLTVIETLEASAAKNRAVSQPSTSKANATDDMVVPTQSHVSHTNATEETALTEESKEDYGTIEPESKSKTDEEEKLAMARRQTKKLLKDVLDEVKGTKEGRMTIKLLFEKLEKSLKKRLIEEVHDEDLYAMDGRCPLLITYSTLRRACCNLCCKIKRRMTTFCK